LRPWNGLDSSSRGVKPDLESVKKEILSSKKYQEKRKKR